MVLFIRFEVAVKLMEVILYSVARMGHLQLVDVDVYCHLELQAKEQDPMEDVHEAILYQVLIPNHS